MEGGRMTKTLWIGDVWQDGMKVDSVSSYKKSDCEREAAHYARVYGQDGIVSTRIKRKTEK